MGRWRVGVLRCWCAVTLIAGLLAAGTAAPAPHPVALTVAGSGTHARAVPPMTGDASTEPETSSTTVVPTAPTTIETTPSSTPLPTWPWTAPPAPTTSGEQGYPVAGGVMPTTTTIRPVVPALTGRVTDTDGVPQGGLCVLLVFTAVSDGGNSTIAEIDANGWYTFWTLPPFTPATSEIVVTCQGESFGTKLNLPQPIPPAPGRLDLVVYERPFLAGQVVDPGDRPIAGVCVHQIAGPDGGQLPDIITDSNGDFGPLEHVVPGPYTFEVRLTCLGPVLEPDGRTPTMTIDADPNSDGVTSLSVHRLGDLLPVP